MRRTDYAEKVTAMTQSLYYLTCTLLSIPQDREDALQNCIVKGLTRCETLRDESKLRPWITRILINECYTLLRQKKRIVLAAEVPTPSPENIDPGLRDAVMTLPDKQRIPFTLNLEGYTAKEIAQALRLPEGTVKTRIRDAKLALRKALQDPFEPEKEVLA